MKILVNFWPIHRSILLLTKTSLPYILETCPPPFTRTRMSTPSKRSFPRRRIGSWTWMTKCRTSPVGNPNVTQGASQGIWIKRKQAYPKHPQISCTLNLEIKRNPLFIEPNWNGKYFNVLPKILALLYHEHSFYQLWHMIDLFLVFVDRNFFIQPSISIDFCITTRTRVECL